MMFHLNLLNTPTRVLPVEAFTLLINRKKYPTLLHIVTVGTREKKKKLDCWSGVYTMNIGYRFFSGKFPLNMHANIGWFFLLFGETDIWLNGIIWCNYFSSGKKCKK